MFEKYASALTYLLIGLCSAIIVGMILLYGLQRKILKRREFTFWITAFLQVLVLVIVIFGNVLSAWIVGYIIFFISIGFFLFNKESEKEEEKNERRIKYQNTYTTYKLLENLLRGQAQIQHHGETKIEQAKELCKGVEYGIFCSKEIKKLVENLTDANFDEMFDKIRNQMQEDLKDLE